MADEPVIGREPLAANLVQNRPIHSFEHCSHVREGHGSENPVSHEVVFPRTLDGFPFEFDVESSFGIQPSDMERVTIVPLKRGHWPDGIRSNPKPSALERCPIRDCELTRKSLKME